MNGYVNEILAGKTEFRSNYDRALAIHKLATSDEEMQNPFSDLPRMVVPSVMARIVATSSISGDSTNRMTIVESCSPQESKAFFDMMSRVAKNAAYSPPLPSGTEGGEAKIVVMVYEVVLVGLAKAFARERSDILQVLFEMPDLQRILLPLT
jgi:hypothetical protein